MKNILKQFAVWATPLSQNDFKKAVVLLTLYYTIGVFIVLTIFNLMVYGLFANSIHVWDYENKERSAIKETRETSGELGEDKLQEIQDNLAKNLLKSDAIILLLTLLVAYVLSKRTLAPLEEAYKKQARFVADAAHELRTPLAVMKAGSEVILRKDRNIDEYKKFLKELLEEIERLTTLSNDLLLLAQNNRKKEILSIKISLSEICEKQIENMKAYADLKNIQIINSVDDNIAMLGNKEELTRLVINLLKNAIDYNQNEGSVTVSLKRNSNNIILSIIDTGIGIGKENISKIFERFYKVDKSRVQNSASTGLGLSIVKEIVDKHNGTIRVDSEIKNGTIFTITFPCL